MKGALLRSLARHAVLVTIAILFLTPMALAVVAALMPEREILTNDFWPHPLRWSNFADAIAGQPLVKETVNTLIIAGLSTVGMLASSIPAAYALARLRWRGRNAALLLVVAAFLLPVQVSSVPLYVGWVRIHLIGTFVPLILPSFLGSAFAIFLLRQFFLSVPNQLLDAYRLEGAGEWRVLWRVVVPMSRPGIAAVALLNVIGVWNDFYSPYLYLGERPENWTVSIGLAQYHDPIRIEWNLTMAAAVLTCLPLVVLFLLAQRALTDAVASQVPTT